MSRVLAKIALMMHSVNMAVEITRKYLVGLFLWFSSTAFLQKVAGAQEVARCTEKDVKAMCGDFLLMLDIM